MDGEWLWTANDYGRRMIMGGGCLWIGDVDGRGCLWAAGICEGVMFMD